MTACRVRSGTTRFVPGSVSLASFSVWPKPTAPGRLRVPPISKLFAVRGNWNFRKGVIDGGWKYSVHPSSGSSMTRYPWLWGSSFERPRPERIMNPHTKGALATCGRP